MSTNDVVAKAAKTGIKLTAAQVYTARSEAKKRNGKPGPKPKAASNAGINGASDELMFKRLVLSIGLPKAEGYLNRAEAQRRPVERQNRTGWTCPARRSQS